MDMLRNVSQVISVRVQTLSEALLLMDFIWKLMQISICYDILWHKTARNLKLLKFSSWSENYLY
jgi:hypothetical protein